MGKDSNKLWQGLRIGPLTNIRGGSCTVVFLLVLVPLPHVDIHKFCNQYQNADKYGWNAIYHGDDNGTGRSTSVIMYIGNFR